MRLVLFQVLQVVVISALLQLSHMSMASAGETLSNGDFEGGQGACGNDDTCPAAWTLNETRPEENSVAQDVTDNGPSAPGTTAWDFDRPSGGVSGDRTTIEHDLDIPVFDGVDYELSLDVKVFSHNLVAGGTVDPAFEWPAYVRVLYVDTNDTTRQWWFGWYLANPGDGARVDDPGFPPHTVTEDQVVLPDVWVSNSFNLADELIDAKTITRVTVGGGGWSYHSRIDNVSLQVVPEPRVALALAVGSALLAGLARRRKADITSWGTWAKAGPARRTGGGEWQRSVP